MKYFLSFSLLLTLTFARAQEIPNDYYYQDYKEKYPSEAFAIIDIDRVDIFNLTGSGVEVTTENYEQFLCLNKNANLLSSGAFYFDGFTEVDKAEVKVYYPDGGKYKKKKFKKFTEENVMPSGVSFYDDQKKLSYQLEKVREGAVVERHSIMTLTEPRLVNSNHFRSDIPIKQETYTIKVEKGVEIGFKEFNMPESGFTFSEYEEGKYKVYKWEFDIREKKNTYGKRRYSRHYTPHIIPYVKSYQHKGEVVKVFETTADLYRWYSSLVQQINPETSEELSNIADSIASNYESELEKVEAIYNWVQDNIKYIALSDGYGGFVPRDPDKIFERRFGDCKDMSCLTIHMLNEVEIPAYFTWVGTRHIPYGYSEISTPATDNHMIATYYSESGEPIFLDATSQDIPFGIPSAFIQGKEVLVGLSTDSFSVETVPVLTPEQTVEIDTAFFTISESGLKGKGKFYFSGYLAGDVYRDFENTPKENLEKYFKNILSKGSNKFNPTNIEYYRVENSKNETAVSYDFEIEDYVNNLGDEIYLNLNLSRQFEQFKIDEKINTPVFFDYKSALNKVYILELP